MSYRWKAITLFMMPATLLLEANLLTSDGKFSNVTSFVLGIFILFSLIAAKRINNNTQQNIRLRIEAANREHALELMHQKQVLHAQQTPLAVIEFDLNLHVTEWNKAAEEIFGYSREEAINNDITKLIAPESNSAEIELLWSNLLNLQSATGHIIENNKKDGGRIFCEWYITPLTKNESEIVGIAAMALDITEKKRVEEALVAAKNESERANQAKSIFLSNVSHEIRTPLNAILGFTQLLSLDKTPNKNQASGINEIYGASQLLLNLVNQILDFSKIEEGC
jgi:PAS domain S-box-containing protein